ncbi:MAG: HipA family kinase [Puniceicoccaceae bacterium]
MSDLMPTVIATRFDKVMGSGRTRPCFLACEDGEGNEMELLVKLTGCPEMQPFKLLCEAFSALLAQDLDLPVPQPYRVEVTQGFAATVAQTEYRPFLVGSVGWNFGLAKWEPGTTLWPRDKTLNKAMRPTAGEILAFDAIIQNPDRRASNPNCAFLGNDFVIFDHESAFSQFLTIFPSNPWDAEALKFLNDHVFRRVLNGGGLDLNRLQGALEAITKERLDAYIAAIPAGWQSSTFSPTGIRDYLLECIDKFDTIKTQLEVLL